MPLPRTSTHPQATPHATVQRISQAFETLSPELQRAARWVLQHPAALALHSMRASAREAGVSPATMTRLAQRLGFDGFETLRAPFVRQLAGGRPIALSHTRVSRTRGSGPAVRLNAVEADEQLVARQLDNVSSALALNPARSLQDAADTMLAADTVYFLGLRVCHGVAQHLHYLHGLLSANGVLLDDHAGTMGDQVMGLHSSAVLVAVSQSPYSRQTVEAVQLAHEQQAQVIALTDSALSPIARSARHVLLFETATTSFFHSTLGAEALVELLLATLATRGGEAAQQRLGRMQQHLRRTRAYWERNRDPVEAVKRSRKHNGAPVNTRATPSAA